MNPLFSNLPTTIFEEMSGRARATGAINLGQGFPEGPGPQDVIAAAADALLTQSNQYAPMAGLPELRSAVAAHYARHQGLDLASDEVIVTSGGTEALAASILSLISPGDEVVLIQPMYDAYLPLVRLAGGIPRFVTLRPPEWHLTAEALDAVMSSRTRAVILNSPVNPTATIFSDAELALLADRIRRYDAIAICDEVWEHIIFDGQAHRPLMTYPDMRDRVVKIGSAGKIFSLTGWKIGWACATPALARVIGRAHQFLTFASAPNLQHAAAFGLAKDDSYFSAMRAEYARSRDRLTRLLRDGGFAVLPSAGTYFLTIDLAGSGIPLDDRRFCEVLVADHGVAAIPLSAFYAEDAVTSAVRLCFAKGDAMLDQAAERLIAARHTLKN